MGTASFSCYGDDKRPPSASEFERIKTLLRDAMSQGAFGLSSGLIYPPNSYMKTDELVELAREAARAGGLYISHVRGEGTTLLEALKEAVAIGERAGLPVEIFHFKATGFMRGKILEAVRIIEEARGRGLDIAAESISFLVAGSTGLSASIPSWARQRPPSQAGREAQGRAGARAHQGRNENGSAGFAPNLVKETGNFENIRVASVRSDSNKKFEGQSIAAIAKERGTRPEDALMDLLIEEQGNVGAIYFSMIEDDVKTAMKFPWVSMGSDGTAVSPEGVLGRGKPHPRFYGTFPRILGKYVREEKILTLEDAVRKMTSLPAARLRLSDRGLLRAGMAADVVVFDPERVIDRATLDDPHGYAEGIDVVVVNGQVVLDEGRHTGASPGRALRGPGYRSAAPRTN